MNFWPLIRLVPHHTHINFVRAAPVAAVISAIAIIASVASVVFIGMNFGVDFAGGTVLEMTTPGTVAPIAQIRAALTATGAQGGEVQGFGANAAMDRFKSMAGQDANGAAQVVKTKLQTAIPGLKVTSQNTVGPKVSGELLVKGAEALVIALLLMLAYIWFRFQLQFGFGAILAVVHDVILTIGMLSITHIEVSMTSIAALLTVIGYSMNEKVISFDRLRENLRKYKTTPLRDVINLSENERLSRTLITGSTALLALSGALVMGGDSLRPLVITMAFGIFIGTYSSVYVALPVILLWGVKRDVEDAAPIDLRPQRSPRR